MRGPKLKRTKMRTKRGVGEIGWVQRCGGRGQNEGWGNRVRAKMWGNRVRAKMWRKKVRANLSEEVLNNSTDTSQETVL